MCKYGSCDLFGRLNGLDDLESLVSKEVVERMDTTEKCNGFAEEDLISGGFRGINWSDFVTCGLCWVFDIWELGFAK